MLRFRSEVDFEDRRALVPYRWLARADGSRLELVAIVDAKSPVRVTALEAPEIHGATAYGIVPTAVARGDAPSFDGDSITEDPWRVAFRTTCNDIACDVTAAWRFELRSWGIKELTFLPVTIVAEGSLAETLRAMGVHRDEAGAFVLDGELGVQPQVRVDAIASGFALTMERIILAPLARPRRDRRFQLRSIRHALGRSAKPEVPTYRFEPPITEDEAPSLLRTSPDPFVAAAAAALVGRDALGDVRRCADSNAENADVRFACLWALSRFGDASDAAIARRVAASTDDERLRDQALKVWAKLDLRTLVTSSDAHVRELLAKHPKLARAPGRAADEIIELPVGGRSIAVAGERVIIGSWKKLFAYDKRAFTALASAECGFERVAASDDGRVIAAATTDGSLFYVGDAPRVVHDAEREGFVAVSRDGTCVATSFDDVTLREPDGARGVVVFPERAAIAWDASNRLYVLGDSALWRWDGALTKLALHDDAARFAVAADGAFAIATGHAIRSWTSDGSVVELDRAHDDVVSCLAFSRDGSLLAAGDHAGTIAVWRRGEPRPLAVFELPDESRVSGVAFAGDALVAVSIDRPALFVLRIGGRVSAHDRDELLT